MKERFKDAQVGDKVYCRVFGNGEIKAINNKTLTVKFQETIEEAYMYSGRLYNSMVNCGLSEEPILFYRDNNSNYLKQK